MSRSSAAVFEEADPQEVPYELELRLVTGEASRALAHLLHDGHLTPDRQASLRRAAQAIRRAASATQTPRTVGAVSGSNLVAAALSAFDSMALDGLGDDLRKLADQLDELASCGDVDRAEIKQLDSQLRRIRAALARSSGGQHSFESPSQL